MELEDERRNKARRKGGQRDGQLRTKPEGMALNCKRVKVGPARPEGEIKAEGGKSHNQCWQLKQ